MILERYAGERVGVVSLVDHFAQVRGTRGFLPVPIPPLRFSLVAREEQAVMTPLDTPVDLIAQSGTSGAYLFSNEQRIGKNMPLQRIEDGRYRLRIDSDYYQRFELDLDWPPLPPQPPVPAPVHLLRPGYAYPFPDVTLPSARITLLRGTLLTGVNGAPVPNATVEITNPPNLGLFVSAVTDGKGAWVLAFRHANTNPIVADVTITIPPQAPVVIQNVNLAPGADNALSYTALRGRVLYVSGDTVGDAEITLDIAPGSVRSNRDGLWTFYLGFQEFAPNTQAQVTALAPNGNSQSTNVQVRNRATVVVPTFQIAN